MTYLRRMIKFAALFNEDLRVNLNVNDEITVDVPYVGKIEGIMNRSVFGSGDDIESACRDYLSKATGHFVRERGGDYTRIERTVTAV